MVQITETERNRVIAAREFVHAASCPQRPRRQAPCPACPRPLGVLRALAVLDERPRDAKAARRALHDAVCMSGCGPDSDHADRTQARPVAALRKFRAQESA